MPSVLQLAQVETPSIRKEDEVLIRIRATTVTTGDCEMRRFQFPSLWLWLPGRLYLGVWRPRKKILGMELAGEVEAVGAGVTRFKEGDRIFGSTGLAFGSYAEFICMPEGAALALKPTNMTFEEAAAVPMGGLNALRFLRRADIQGGQKVLINGACGSIGTMAVQLAKAFGAEVTAVDGPGKLDVLRSIGADRVIDYTREDFTQSGQTYDVVFDVVGKTSFAGCIRSLTERGTYLIANPKASDRFRGWWTSKTSAKKVFRGAPAETAGDLESLKGLIEEGKIKSVIDRRYSLQEMAEAHAYVDTGQKKGNVVITVVPS